MLAKVKRRHKLQTGLTLIELLITAGILVVALGGLLQLFVYCQKLGATAGQLTLALSDAQTEMEKIRNYNFDDIVTDYSAGETPGNTFDLTPQLTGKGIIYIDNTDPELLEVEIVVSWKTMGGRIIGEDNGSGAGGIALDGELNGDEDANSDLRLNSPTSLITLIAKR